MSALRNISIAALCALCVLFPVSCTAAAPVLVLKGPNAGPYKDALNGFHQAFPGAIEVAHGKEKEFSNLVAANPHSLIVAIGRASAEMAHERAPSLPLIFVLVANPAESGLSGTNIAGISMDIPGDVQLAHFKELLPNPKKPIGVIYNPSKSAALIAQAKQAAPGLDLSLEQVPVESAEQVRMRIALVKPIIGAIWVVPDESYVTRERANKWFTFLQNETSDLHVPLFVTMNAGSTFVQDGAVAALVSDFFGMGRQSGEVAKQIIDGKLKIQDLGIQPPSAIHWELNRGAAEKIGLTLPPAILQSAKVYH